MAIDPTKAGRAGQGLAGARLALCWWRSRVVLTGRGVGHDEILEATMAQLARLALDAMGGDFGPSVTVEGAAIALERRPDSSFLMFGDKTLVEAELARHPALAARTQVFHSSVAVKMDDKPSVALRQGRRVSSMWMAIEAVKKGEADAAISAGNTGALMAMAKICLKTMAQIDRPALACLWPTLRGKSVVLDVGATIGGDARHLVDLAVMGSAMARIVLQIETPSVGLLNVGAEEIKGAEEVKAASKILRASPIPGIDYRGFVEGDAIGRGEVDVVVTEGFTGNIALKTAEGTQSQVRAYLREALAGSLMTKFGVALAYPFVQGAYRKLRSKLDKREINGAVFLGVDGVVIKSHGGYDAIGFARAIELGYEMVRYDLLAKIRASALIAHAGDAPEPAPQPQEIGS